MSELDWLRKCSGVRVERKFLGSGLSTRAARGKFREARYTAERLAGQPGRAGRVSAERAGRLRRAEGYLQGRLNKATRAKSRFAKMGNSQISAAIKEMDDAALGKLSKTELREAFTALGGGGARRQPRTKAELLTGIRARIGGRSGSGNPYIGRRAFRTGR